MGVMKLQCRQDGVSGRQMVRNRVHWVQNRNSRSFLNTTGLHSNRVGGKFFVEHHRPVIHRITVQSQTGEGNESSDAKEEGKTNSGNQEKTAWYSKIFKLPLELALTLSREDAHYLEKRGRKRWWRKSFPRVPADSIENADSVPPSLSLWQKVLPLGAIFFAASFNLAILQSLKDSIMVTTAGAETLPFLASFVVLPSSLAFFVMYGRMVEILPTRMVFYVAFLPLVSFYILFATVLYPNCTLLHPSGLIELATGIVPEGLMGLVRVIQYWSFSLFYCAAELWGSVVISVLFWSLANEVCSVTEAKSVYPLMGIAANVALVLSGNFVKIVNTVVAVGNTQAALNWLVGGVVAMSCAMALAKAALDKWVIGPYCSLDPSTARKPEPKKKKGNLAQSLNIIRSSPKISNLAILVISYGISHRLFEFSWKASLKALYPTAQAYQTVLADVAIATGWATISFMLLGRYVFQYLGWGSAASATPIAMLLSGGAFFALLLLSGANISIFGLDPTAMAFAGVAAGAVTQVFARSSKFSLFDPAKEMVYIEMSKEEKSKGKAAVDLIGSQIGKSGGAWVTQLLLLITGSLNASLPIIATTFLAVILSWLNAVRSLGRYLRIEEAERASLQEASEF